MKKLIVDDKIVLIPMTSQLYHIERKNYIADPMMCETPYIYTPEIAQKKILKEKQIIATEYGLLYY